MDKHPRNDDTDADEQTGARVKVQKPNDEEKSKKAFEQNLPSEIKLNLDACFQLFDYLSLKIICSMGETSKYYNEIAGTYSPIQMQQSFFLFQE